MTSYSASYLVLCAIFRSTVVFGLDEFLLGHPINFVLLLIEAEIQRKTKLPNWTELMLKTKATGPKSCVSLLYGCSWFILQQRSPQVESLQVLVLCSTPCDQCACRDPYSLSVGVYFLYCLQMSPKCFTCGLSVHATIYQCSFNTSPASWTVALRETSSPHSVTAAHAS